MTDNNEERRDQTMLHEVHTRLAVVEQYIRAREIYERDDRKYLRGLAVAFILQILAVIGGAAWTAVEMGRWMQRVDSIDVVDIGNQTRSNLGLFTEQADEIHIIEAEQFRIRAIIDTLRGELRAQTKGRFYISDGERLERRITRIEDWYLNNDKELD